MLRLSRTGGTPDIRNVTILLHEDAAVSEDFLKELKKVPKLQVQSAAGRVIAASIDRTSLDLVADLDPVQAIEATVPVTAQNDHTQEILHVNLMNKFLKNWTFSKNLNPPELTGAGQIVAVADTGVDIGSDAFKDQDKVKKVVAREWYGHVKQPALGSLDSDDYTGHGTHVAGTVLGSPIKDWENNDVTGVARNAQLMVQTLTLGPLDQFNVPAGTTYSISTDIKKILEDAYAKNVRIHNNSWGSSINQQNPQQLRYSATDAEILDTIALEKPDFLIVFAAGNEGWYANAPTNMKSQIGAYAVAKNILTVGATFGDRPSTLGGPKQLERFDPKAPSPNPNKGKVPLFSSKGPVKNTARTKPDLVAPGVCILSARNTEIKNVTKLQEWIQDFGEPLGGIKKEQKLIYCSGTSMAAPAVSGCAALLREGLARMNPQVVPSAPLMKALLINGTRPTINVPREEQGFGQLDMFRVMNHLWNDTNSNGGHKRFMQGVVNSGTGAKTTVVKFNSIVPSLGQASLLRFTATFVYHDAPGEVIQYRLGLQVKPLPDPQPRQDYTTANTAAFNNVQRIDIANVVSGNQMELVIMVEDTLLHNIPWGLAWDYTAM